MTILMEISGFIAAALVFATFCMKTMMPLRIVAIVSNVAFIVYGVIGDLHPVLLLHVVLLPLNLFRTYQIRRLVRQVAEASKGDLSLDWLIPMMTPRRFAKGDVLFRKGDTATEVFYVVHGTVKTHDHNQTVGPGSLIGEIGVFSPARLRTQTVSCETDVETLVISDQKMYELYYQNPKLGFYLMRLIIGRLLEDMAQPEFLALRAAARQAT